MQSSFPLHHCLVSPQTNKPCHRGQDEHEERPLLHLLQPRIQLPRSSHLQCPAIVLGSKLQVSTGFVSNLFRKYILGRLSAAALLRRRSRQDHRHPDDGIRTTDQNVLPVGKPCQNVGLQHFWFSDFFLEICNRRNTVSFSWNTQTFAIWRQSLYFRGRKEAIDSRRFKLYFTRSAFNCNGRSVFWRLWSTWGDSRPHWIGKTFLRFLFIFHFLSNKVY